jgi:hypothetical protein
VVVRLWGGFEELGDCEEIDQECTKCTLLECQFITEFSEVYELYNKKFTKDSGLAEIESKILPQFIRTRTEA